MNTNTTADAKTTWPPDNTEMLELYQPIVEGMTKYSGALSDGYAAMGSEWFNFINRRFHTDISLAGRLAKCGSPQDLMREWSAFVSMASEDYRNEFARLAEMSSATSQRAASAIHVNGQGKARQGDAAWASRGV
jgi:Phasin protein